MCDLAALYVSAVGYEESLWVQRQNSTPSGEEPDHEAIDADMVALWNQLPPELFPLLTKYSPEMTTGDGHDRFEFAADVLWLGWLPCRRNIGDPSTARGPLTIYPRELRPRARDGLLAPLRGLRRPSRPPGPIAGRARCARRLASLANGRGAGSRSRG